MLAHTPMNNLRSLDVNLGYRASQLSVCTDLKFWDVMHAASKDPGREWWAEHQGEAVRKMLSYRGAATRNSDGMTRIQAWRVSYHGTCETSTTLLQAQPVLRRNLTSFPVLM